MNEGRSTERRGARSELNSGRSGTMEFGVKPEHIKQFESLTDELNKLMIEIEDYNSDAILYIEDSDNFNLMSGYSHDVNGRPIFDNVVCHAFVRNSTGGAW